MAKITRLIIIAALAFLAAWPAAQAFADNAFSQDVSVKFPVTLSGTVPSQPVSVKFPAFSTGITPSQPVSVKFPAFSTGITPSQPVSVKFPAFSTGITPSQSVSVKFPQTANGLVSSTGISAVFGAPAGMWHMDNNWQDSSGNNLHGTAYGNAYFEPNGILNNAGGFNGSTSYINIGTSSLLRPPMYLSIMGWAKIPPGSSGNMGIAGNIDESSKTGYALIIKDGVPQVKIGNGSLVEAVSAGVIPPDGTWFHLAGTYDGTSLKLYVNGQVAGEKAVPAMVLRHTNPFYIGYSSAGYFSGAIDELAVYPRALSETEILRIVSTAVVDVIPPSVPTVDPVTSPTTSQTVILSGTKDADSSILVNNVPAVPIDNSTTWQYEKALAEGNNILNISSMDEEGNQSKAVTLTILFDSTPPSITDSWPLDNSFINKNISSVVFNLIDKYSEIDLAATVKNANVIDVSGLNVSGTWTTSGTGTVTFIPFAPFADGLYTAVIYPTDSLGNRGSGWTTFTIDTSPPPAPTIDPVLSPTRTASQTIKGTKSSDSVGVVVTGTDLSIGTIAYPSATTWNTSISGLKDGGNTISVYAVDAAGNASQSASVTINVDTIPPVPPIVMPAVSPTKDSSVTLTGSKEAGSDLYINGIKTSATASEATWSYTANLNEGNNTFTLYAKDAVDNQSQSVTVNIVRDTTAPVISSSTPTINAYTNQAGSIEIILSDSYSSIDLQESLNGAVVKDSSGAMVSGQWSVGRAGLIFTPSVAFTDSVYTVMIYPVDSLGNKGTVSFTFTLDSVPPVIRSLVMTPDGPYRAEAVTFTMTFNEEMLTSVQPAVSFTRGLLYSTYTVSGKWIDSKTWQGSYQFTTDSGDGTYTIKVSGAKDKAQNIMATNETYTFVLDTAAPPPPTIDAVTSPTRNSSITLTGKKEAGTYLYINNVKTTALYPDVTWSYNAVLSEGNNAFTITVKDDVGNQSQPVTVNVVRDTTPPSISSSVPAANAVIAQAAAIDILLSDSYSSVDLQASAVGASVKDGAVSTVGGQWSADNGHLIFTPSTALTDSGYMVTLYPVDSLGNKGNISFIFTIDGTSPSVQSLTMSPDSPHKAETVTFTIAFNEDMLTSVQSTVSFTRGGSYPTYTLTGSWIDAKTWRGNYTLTTTTGDGNYTVRVTGAKDKAQNLISVNEAYTFVLDTLSPAAPTVDATSSPTKNMTVTLTGIKDTASYLYINSTKTSAGYSEGTWSYTSNLTEGSNSFTIYLKDDAGNQSQQVTLNIVRDTTAPTVLSAAPANNSYINHAETIEIVLSDSYSSVDLQSSLVGASVKDGAGNLMSGQWSAANDHLIFTPSSAFPDSTYNVVFYPTDSLGNKGTAALNFIIDNAVPILQSLTMSPGSPHKSETVTFTAVFNEDLLTSVQPAVSFTRGGSNPVYTLSGSWTNSKTWSGSYTFTSTTGDGAYSIKVSGAKDKAQNLMAANEAYAFVLDAAAPGVPTVSAVSTPTRNSTVTLTGTKDTEAYLYINNTKISASGYSDGIWSYTASLNEGNNAFTISLKDEAGNQSPSVAVSVVKDTTPPAISSSTPANNAYTMQVGTIEIALSDTYSSVDLQASLEGDVVKNSGGTAISGQWSVAGGRLVFTPSTPLTDSTYTVTLYPVDSLGNKGTATLNFTVDSTPPTVQSLTMSPDTPHKAEQVTFNITFNEDMSTASQPTVTFSRGYFYSTYAVSGNWVNSKTWSGTYQFTANNGDGTYTTKVSDAKDRAGNTMTANENATFVLDTSPPQAPTVSAVTTPTKTPTITLSGTKPADTAVVINGTQRVALGSSTSWSYTYNLAEGQNNLSITARDAAGNDSTAVTTSIILDTTPPSFTVNYVNPSPTQTQTITGTKEAGCIVKLNSGTIFDSADQNTSWSYAVSLTEGLSNHLVFTASDSIGNTTTKTIDILYDLSSPSPLAEGMLVADGGGKGTEVTLTWPSYAESSDLAYYRIYYSTSNFTGTAGMTASGTANKGTKTFKVSGLTQGTTYYFAVVPVDASGNSDPQVYTASAVPTDTAAPEEVTSLTAQAGFNSLNGNYIKLNWTASANSIGDMADQIIYFDGGTGYDSGTSVGKSATSYLKSSLKDALKYKFKITTKDAAGHESTGVVAEAVTRLSNPTGLTAAPGNQKMILTWSAVSSSYVKQYNIYRAQSSAQQYFAADMTLIKSLTSTSFTDTNLTNGTVYQYAVTVVNTYGAEKTDDLYSISATPRGDTTGPVISGLNITPNQVVSAPITITASAQDAESSMGKMEVYIDGGLVEQASCLSQAGSPCPITYSWNVVSTTDGNHSVKIAAYDSLGNASEVSVPVVVSLAPPVTPAITGHNVVQASPEYLVKVSGSAQISTTVTLKVNGVVVSQLPTPDSGLFTFDSLKLTEGDNIISAKTSHRGGDSAWSPDYKITVDTGAPNAPVSITAKALAGGTLQFTWQAGAGEVPTGYNLYVSSSTFASKADAGVTKANASPIAYMFREYIPADDNKKYYAATALDSAGNESAISNVISISADRTSPSLASIGYTYTDISGTVKEGATLAGPGTVKAAITVSEPLSELPFFSLEPVDGSPIVVSLKKSSTTPAPPYQGGEIYEGTFTVNAQTPYGTTTYKFSGKDIIGNRGNSQGTGLTIDSRGPIASVTSPVTLLQITDSPVEVKVSFDEAPVSTPVLEVKDSKGVSINILPSPPAGEGQGGGATLNWTGTVNISGLSEGTAEFVLKEIKDSLGNISTKVGYGKSILLYKDSVPAPSVPTGLTAKTAKEGKINLRWDNVSYQQSAVTYNVYRRAEGETTAIQVGWALPTNTLSDIPPADGKYYYSVTSLGLLNSESAKSNEVSAISDRTGPPTPTGLVLSLDGNGVKAVWTTTPAPPYQGGELTYYRLYRSDGGITTISGLTPVATVNTTTASDPSPTSSKRFYAVTSMDSLGNESAPSETQEIVFPVGPVRNLVLTKVDSGKPSLSWQAPEGSIQGYHIYRNGNKITETPTLSTAYSDGYYSGGSITYGISAVDDLGSESPVREATLPDMTIGLKEGTTLRRGALETVNIVASGQWSVAGSQNMTIDAIALKIGALPESTLNGPFAFTPGTLDPLTSGTLEIKKVASTEANAPSEVAVVTTAIMNPSPGTTVKITKTSTANVLSSGTALEIFNEPLVRGTTGKVRIKVNNLGSARTEFLTSQNNGPTSQVKVNLRDQDGNLLATGNLDQRTGDVVSSGSYATARIEAGSSFLSDPITFSVPASAPYKVLIEAIIDNTYYHYNQTDQVTAPGLKQSVESTIVETAYRATASPEKTIYKQGETIKITGQAVSNAPSPLAGEGGGEGVPNVPVKIGISVKGFDRYYTVSSDENGNFAYTFTPGSNEAGAYTVWANHPDITDRGNQGQFSIVGLQLEPTVANIKMGKGQSFDIPVTLKNLGDTTLADISYAITTSGGITAGVINSGDNTLTANESQGIAVRITADSSAPDTGTAAVQWTVASGEDILTVKLDANITLVKPIPIISTSPSYIDTGLVRGTQKIYTFDIKNTGLDTLKNARLEGPTISWLSLTVDKNIGDIGVNQSKTVGVMVKPDDSVVQGVYNDRITIYSDNHIPYTYNIQVTVTSNAVGNVLFDVLNELMEDVSNASITFQHQTLTELIYNLKTSADGTVSQFDIPEGRYTFNITATGHKPTSGTFSISPGITTTVPIALELNMVSIEWSVVPTTIQDQYEIKITQTFETNVPAPVLITEPPSITLPDMTPGQVFNGEYTVTNYGLIAVDNVKINFPTSFGEYDIEILTSTIPKSIGAMQKITVPYRITRRLQTSSLVSYPSSLFDEVVGYGSGQCFTAAPPITTCGTVVICPNTPQQKTVEKCTSYSLLTPTQCPEGSSSGYVPYYYTGSSSVGSQATGAMPGESPASLNTGNPCDCKKSGDCCGDAQMCVSNECSPVRITYVEAKANDKKIDYVAFGETVQFEGKRDGQNCIYEYLWDFGDGKTSTALSPSHKYEQPGIYNVTFTVSCKKCPPPPRTASVTVYVVAFKIVKPAPDEKVILRNVKVNGELNPIINQTIEWKTVVEGSENMTTTQSHADGTIVVIPFPENNSSFGPNTVNAKVVLDEDTTLTDSANVKYFYYRDENENPSPDPNWYYYWSQTSANCSQNHVYGGDHCSGNFGYYYRGDRIFHICDLAKGDNSVTGDNGIDTFAETCLHENTHMTNYWDWWGNSGGYDSARDKDGDKIPDEIEPAMGFDPTKRDTDGDSWNDEHDLAYDIEHTWSAGTASREDWSVPGKQY